MIFKSYGNIEIYTGLVFEKYIHYTMCREDQEKSDPCSLERSHRDHSRDTLPFSCRTNSKNCI